MNNARISLGTVCVGIGFMLSACTPPSENWQRTQILSGLPVHGLQGLNFGPDGTIYVTRSADNGIVAIDPKSGAQTVIVRSHFAGPGGMTVDASGAVWVVTDADNGLVKLTPP